MESNNSDNVESKYSIIQNLKHNNEIVDGDGDDDTDDKKLMRFYIPNFLLNSKFAKYLNTVCPEEFQNDVIFIITGIAKGFLIYFGAFTLLKRKADPKIVKRALAVATFSGTVRLVDRIFKYLHIFRKKQYYKRMHPLIIKTIEFLRKYPRFIQGVFGSIASLLVDGSFDSAIFVLWVLVRAIRFSFPYPVPSWTSIFFLSISSSHILSSWIKAPDEIDPQYLKFLDYMGGENREIINFLGGSNGPPIHCWVLHPGLHCYQYLFNYYNRCFMRSIKLYVPLCLFFFAISKKREVSQFFINLLRSTLFLSIYCTGAICSGCLIYPKFPYPTRAKLLTHTWIAGLAGIFERASRRNELAAYVTTYALDSLYRGLVKRKFVRSGGWPILGRITLILSIALLLHHHQHQPFVISKWLLALRDTDYSINPLNSSPDVSKKV